ncbi:MAG: PHP domain-containing protein [Candidatus Ratteibacteria bacterium]
MKIKSDWHIHTQNSCDEGSIKVKDLIKKTEEKGILYYGISDHFHTIINLPDIVNSRKEYEESNPPSNFYFGIEVSVVSKWEIEEIEKNREKYKDAIYGIRRGGPSWAEPAVGIDEEIIKKLKIEYVIGGVHWPLYVEYERESIIKDYHRQLIFLASHPLIDIIAHPWWWMGKWEENGMYLEKPWFDNFSIIPESMHNEFIFCVKKNKKLVEINLEAMILTKKYPLKFKYQYLEYLKKLEENGVVLCIGSDCHSPYYDIDFEKAEKLLDWAGIKVENLSSIKERR